MWFSHIQRLQNSYQLDAHSDHIDIFLLASPPPFTKTEINEHNIWWFKIETHSFHQHLVIHQMITIHDLPAQFPSLLLRFLVRWPLSLARKYLQGNCSLTIWRTCGPVEGHRCSGEEPGWDRTVWGSWPRAGQQKTPHHPHNLWLNSRRFVPLKPGTTPHKHGVNSIPSFQIRRPIPHKLGNVTVHPSPPATDIHTPPHPTGKSYTLPPCTREISSSNSCTSFPQMGGKCFPLSPFSSFQWFWPLQTMRFPSSWCAPISSNQANYFLLQQGNSLPFRPMEPTRAHKWMQWIHISRTSWNSWV